GPQVCTIPTCQTAITCEREKRAGTCTDCQHYPDTIPERLQLWLLFLGFDTNTPVDVLREADHRVCALHFRREDYVQSTGLRKKSPRKLYLKRAAVPTLLGPTVDEEDLGVTKIFLSTEMSKMTS
uniref:THAP-type domain-containing protein n=1 Tax=Cyprinodon variegatus TaxID=28743 RepID=A0A3Q2C9P0_CYPVA